MRNYIKMCGVVAGMLMMATAAHGQVIRLEKQITVEAHADVRLGDMARVSGVDAREAEALSNIVILSGVDTTRSVKAESVLLALMSQVGAQRLGSSLELGGSAACLVTVTPRGGAAGTAAAAVSERPLMTQMDTVITVDSTPAPIAAMAVMADAPVAHLAALGGAAPAIKANDAEHLTLAKLINLKAQEAAGLPAERVRVTIDTMSAAIDAAVPAGRKWLCRPLTRTLIGTVQFEAQLVEGTRVIDKLNVLTKIEWSQMAVVNNISLQRGDLVAPGSVTMKEVWLDRGLPTLFGAEKDVVGMEAVRAIDAGGMLDQRDFKPTLLAAKGDMVQVIYVSGTVKITTQGRAMDDGKMHDKVQLRNEATHEIYEATLIGKRLAVVGDALSEADEDKLRESQ